MDNEALIDIVVDQSDLPSVLVTNDDGIYAKGLEALVQVLEKKYRVYVVAPEVEQSAVGHALTLTQPLRVKKVKRNGAFFGYGVNGTPADCVKIALHELIKPRPQVLVSGINLGPNVGINVIYSGTVSAATEGAMMGLSSLAVSLDSYESQDFRAAAEIGCRLADHLIRQPLPPGVSLNCNVPDRPLAEIKGIRLTRQGTFRFVEKFDKRIDPRENTYYWQAGIQPPPEEAPDTDHALLSQGYVTLTPITFDLTHYSSLLLLQGMESITLSNHFGLDRHSRY
jgi:5'-nucleotidase